MDLYYWPFTTRSGSHLHFYAFQKTANIFDKCSTRHPLFLRTPKGIQGKILVMSMVQN